MNDNDLNQQSTTSLLTIVRAIEKHDSHHIGLTDEKARLMNEIIQILASRIKG